jgi:hypothetical protein
MACQSPLGGRASFRTPSGYRTPQSWVTRRSLSRGVFVLGAILGLTTTLTSAYGQPRIGDPAPIAAAPAGVAQAQPPDNLPPPRKVSELLIEHPRLEGLGTAMHPGLGRTPIPTKEELERINKYVEKFIDPQSTIDLILNRPRLWRLTEPPIRIQIPEENILAYTPGH